MRVDVFGEERFPDMGSESVWHGLLVRRAIAGRSLKHCQQVDSGTPFASHVIEQGHPGLWLFDSFRLSPVDCKCAVYPARRRGSQDVLSWVVACLPNDFRRDRPFPSTPETECLRTSFYAVQEQSVNRRVVEPMFQDSSTVRS